MREWFCFQHQYYSKIIIVCVKQTIEVEVEEVAEEEIEEEEIEEEVEEEKVGVEK